MERNRQDKALEEAILKASGPDRRLPCARAFQVAEEQGVPRARVGEACNRLGVKISRCQLGCFQ